jgi:hypothetical protein
VLRLQRLLQLHQQLPKAWGSSVHGGHDAAAGSQRRQRRHVQAQAEAECFERLGGLPSAWRGWVGGRAGSVCCSRRCAGVEDGSGSLACSRMPVLVPRQPSSRLQVIALHTVAASRALHHHNRDGGRPVEAQPKPCSRHPPARPTRTPADPKYGAAAAQLQPSGASTHPEQSTGASPQQGSGPSWRRWQPAAAAPACPCGGNARAGGVRLLRPGLRPGQRVWGPLRLQPVKQQPAQLHLCCRQFGHLHGKQCRTLPAGSAGAGAHGLGYG